ncbi:preprotein translocase subunit SecG [Falsirhodobacter sp. alg1]|uniref:preprotein translocase subunit SecG n=1 Tax=Falsirhodobacter sp. alg1 TaxID=1472418 RepID=UPI0005F0418C|nr:preprotein translocase subunit SecG [Falsirhodobacter sp. alg1]
MENVILTVHLILALLLVGIVLLQRSEGGGLGMGSSGGGGAMTQRQAANVMTRATWVLAIAFICTSLALTIVAASNSSGGSVLDQIGGQNISSGDDADGDDGSSLLPPTTGNSNTPLVPPRADETPAAPAPAN